MTVAWNQSVHSSMVAAVAYDPDTQEMLVTFNKNNKTVAYEGVPEEIAQRCANAPSVGQFLNSEIKGVYPFRYV